MSNQDREHETDAQKLERIFDDAFTAMLGGPERRAAIEHLYPRWKPGSGRLANSLQSSAKAEWPGILREYMIQRAQDCLSIHKDGDLFHRDGDWLINGYAGEVSDALRTVLKTSRARWRYEAPAFAAFIETAEAIRESRIGNAEQRAATEAAGYPNVEFSPTLEEHLEAERAQAEGRVC